MDESEDEACPLCLEPLDETDRRVLSYCGGVCSFLPCLFCHQRLLVENQACPNCRQPYDQDKVLVEQARCVVVGRAAAGRSGRSAARHTRGRNRRRRRRSATTIGPARARDLFQRSLMHHARSNHP
jgi:hypothetical protein